MTKVTLSTVTCDRCHKEMEESIWKNSFNVRKDAVYWEANQMLDGDYCVSCSILFDKAMQEAYAKWLKL